MNISKIAIELQVKDTAILSVLKKVINPAPSVLKADTELSAKQEKVAREIASKLKVNTVEEVIASYTDIKEKSFSSTPSKVSDLEKEPSAEVVQNYKLNTQFQIAADAIVEERETYLGMKAMLLHLTQEYMLKGTLPRNLEAQQHVLRLAAIEGQINSFDQRNSSINLSLNGDIAYNPRKMSIVEFFNQEPEELSQNSSRSLPGS